MIKQFSYTALTLFLSLLLGYQSALANELAVLSKSAENASVYFISPSNGDIVSSPVRCQFGLKGMGVAPAGVMRDDTGHHHLLINVDELPDLTQSLPATDNILHFGKGQTEADIELPPGKHTLQLILGDAVHRPHEKPLISEKITITVE